MSKPTTPKAPSHDELNQLRQRVSELEQALEQHQHTAQKLVQQIATLQEHVHLLDLVQDAVLVRNLEGKIVFWNQKAEQLYGWSQDEALGNTVHAILQTQSSTPVTEIEANLLQTGIWTGELTQTSRDGTKLIVHSHWELQRHAWGQSAVVVEVNHDITKHKQTEMELRASEAEIRALVAAIDDVIFVFDREGYYLKIAPTNPKLPYKVTTNLIGRRMHEILPVELADFLLTIVQQALEASKVVQVEYPLLVGEQEFWFSGVVSPISDEAVVWIAHDITERKRTQQEQVRLGEQIIRTQAAMLADLSTPLIPLNDHVFVMPIIGVIDSQRAQAMLGTLLEGMSSQRVSVVIVDITGVPQVDTQVAKALIHAAQNAETFGAQLILTGLRAEVAQTLVMFGVDLDEVITRSTLQGGIAYALELVSQRPRP